MSSRLPTAVPATGPNPHAIRGDPDYTPPEEYRGVDTSAWPPGLLCFKAVRCETPLCKGSRKPLTLTKKWRMVCPLCLWEMSLDDVLAEAGR